MRDFVIADCELTTGAIAALTGAKLREGDPVDRPIRNIAPLDTAGASDISFLDNSKFAGELATTRAAACLIAPRFVERAPRSLVVLETAQPYPAFVAVTRKLFANLLRPTSMFGVTGRAASAQIDPTARLEAGVAVDPLAVIGPRAAIGAGTLIGPGVVIGPDVRIGRRSACSRVSGGIPPRQGVQVLLARASVMLFAPLENCRPHLRPANYESDIAISASQAFEEPMITDRCCAR